MSEMEMQWGFSPKNSEEDSSEKKEGNKNNIPNNGSNLQRIENNIYFYSEIEDKTIFSLINNIKTATLELQQLSFKFNNFKPEINLFIKSNGGGVFAAFALTDVIENNPVPINTIVQGSAVSAATIISVFGKKRYIQPNSYMLIHQLSNIHWGNFEQLKDDMKNSEKLMEKIYKIYDDKTKLGRPKIEEILKRDLYFDASECLEYGLVDEIKTIN